MRPSDSSLGLFIALFLLSGCGGSTTDPPSGGSSNSTASASGARGDGTPATAQPDSGTRSQTATPSQALANIPGNTKPPVPASREPEATAPGLLSADRSTSSSKSQPDEEAHEQEAWRAWYEGARESPDVTVRLQALETWAQRPSDQLDPVTYELVDEDEQVRERAQALYTQQLQREAAAAEPVDQATQEP